MSATLPAIFGIVNTPIHSKRHVIDIASAIIYPGTTSAKHDIVNDIGAALTIASVTKKRLTAAFHSDTNMLKGQLC